MKQLVSYSQFALNEAAGNVEKLKHLEHLEEFLYHGVDSVRNAINALRDLRDTLSGHSRGSVNVTKKLDGAPSLVFGTHPETGEFIVAKKSLFNKNPIFYRTEKEISDDSSLNGGLADKFKAALRWLPKVTPKGSLFQGDLMFTRSDLGSEIIDGQAYHTFHPNTLVYAVEQGSELGNRIKSANIGIVVHTRYTGSTLADMKASFNVTTKDLLTNDNVWAVGPEIQDLSGTATMTASETADVTALLSQAGKIFTRIGSGVLSQLAANPDLIIQIEAYNNANIRKGEFITNSAKHVNGLINTIHAKFQKEIDTKKTDKGRQTWMDKRDAMLAFFDDSNKKNLVDFFDMMIAIVNAKILIIAQLNKIDDLKAFIKTRDGFVVPTSGEGFVAVDTNGKVLKLVDRLQFSKNNFSSEVIKGWERS
jgi:hypothetical protein